MRLSLALLLLSFGAACASGGHGTVTHPAEPPEALFSPRAATGPIGRANAMAPPRLEVFCDDSGNCPSAVAMVVFPGGETPERCTGTLVAADLVLTASHCIDQRERRLGPADDGWVAFPQTTDHPLRWHRVAEVVAVQPGKAVLEQDHALLRLTEPSHRPPVAIAAEGPEEGSVVTLALVTPHPVYPTQHRLETRLCRVATSASAVSALGPQADTVGWLSACPILPGNSGSPVLDSAGRIRAIVHGGSHPFFGIGVTSRPAALPETVQTP